MTANDDLLQRFVLGEVSEFDAEWHAALAADPGLLARAEELRDVMLELDRSALQSRAELLEDGDAELEAAARRAMERAMRESSPRRWILVALTAAAAVFLIWFLARTPDGARIDDDAPLPLGSAELVLEAPLGSVKDYDTFSWKHEQSPGGWYELRIYDARTGEIALEKEVEEPRWTPTDTERAKLPRELRWEVRAYSLAGDRPVVSSGSASRSD